MTIRTTTSEVTFAAPFALDGHGGLLPAGTHTLEIDEELLQGPSFEAWRRTLTLLHVRLTPPDRRLGWALVIEPHALEAALQRDRAAAVLLDSPLCSDAMPAAPTPRQAADRLAVERAENEGMSPPELAAA